MFPRSQQVFIENRSVSPTFRANYQQIRQIKSYCKTKNINNINFENKSQQVVQGKTLSPQRQVIKSKIINNPKISSNQSFINHQITESYQLSNKRQASQLSNIRQINNQSSTMLNSLCKQNSLLQLQELGAPLQPKPLQLNIIPEDTDFSISCTAPFTCFEQEINSKYLDFSLSYVTHKLMSIKKQNRMKFMIQNINDQFEKKSYSITKEDINKWLEIPSLQPQKYGLRYNMSILKDEREMAENNIRQIQKSIEQNFLGKNFVVYLAMMKKQKRFREKQLDAIDLQKDIFLEFSVIFNKVLFQVQ